MRHVPIQFDLFTTPVGREFSDSDSLEPVDFARQLRLHKARHDLSRRAQIRLSSFGLWGCPNMVSNPAGPWKEYRGSIWNPQARLGCWPASYILRAGTDEVQRFTVRVRPGCSDNPAIPSAAKVLAELAPVSVFELDWTMTGTEYEAD